MSKNFALVSQLIAIVLLGVGMLIPRAAQAQVANGSFELPRLADRQTVEPFPIGYGWVASGSVGLVRDAAYYGANPYRVEPPMGRQWAVLRPSTSLSQSLTLSAGSYYISMNAMQSIGTQIPLTLRVTLNGLQQVLIPQDLTSAALGATAPTITFGPFSVAAGSYTLLVNADSAIGGGIYLDNVVMYKQGANAPPSVAVVYPNPGQAIVNATTELRATALDVDGTVSQVRFFDGATLLGTVTAPPWNLSISTASNATRSITAKAFDGIVETTSDAIVFSHNTGIAPPYITNGNFESQTLPNGGSATPAGPWFLTAGRMIAQGYSDYYPGNVFSRPSEGRQSGFLGITGYPGEYIQYYYLTLPAAGNYGMSFYASVPNGELLNVANAFTGNSITLGGGSGRQTLPFTVNAGVLFFSPKFQAQIGAFALTTVDDIRVGPAGPPTVSVVVPNDAQAFVAPTALTLLAAVDSYDRNITEVEFFQGATSLGKSITYPYSVTWVNVPPGTYTITAKVKDSLSAGAVSALSAPITITVNPPATPAFFNAGFEYRSYSGYSDFINAARPPQGWRGGGTVGYTWAAANGYAALGGLSAPEGITAAGVHPTSWVEQDVYFAAGTYQVRFKAAQVTVGGLSAQVRVNGIAVGSPFTPSISYADYTSANFTVATAGMQTVRVESATPAATAYLVVDDFRMIVVPNPPTVTNSFSPTSTLVTGTSSMTIAVTNSNPIALTGVAFTDTYPAGLTNSASPAATVSGGCGGTLAAVPNGGSFALSAGNIPANTTCTYAVQVLATSSGLKTNSTGPVSSANAAAGSAATATLNVTLLAAPTVVAALIRQSDPPPSVSTTFSQNTTAIGGFVRMTVTIQNPNATAVTGAALAISYPPGISNYVPSGAGSDCPGAILDAPAGAGYFLVSNATIPTNGGNGTCSFFANLNPSTVGFKALTIGALTSTNAISAPGTTATITVVDNPGPPTNVVASPGTFSSINVTFSPPAYDGGMPIHHYAAYAVGYPFGGEWFCASPCSSIRIGAIQSGFAVTIRVVAQHVGQSAYALSNAVTALSSPWQGSPAPTAVAGNGYAIIAFTPVVGPGEGGTPILFYTATSAPGGFTGTCTVPCTSITVTGLTSGVAYTFSVRGTNAIGSGPPTVASNSVTPTGTPVGPPIYYIWADQLNTPRAITTSDALSMKVWEWKNDEPFGNNAANENPSGLGTFAYNMRFPGQYADKETGTFYNYFRDYDPATGRYVQSDPIGLAGGLNTFSYVGASPLIYTDPTGLIYRCKAPLHAFPGGFFGGKGPLHHAFVCDDAGGNCYGQDWKNEKWWHNPLLSPGRPSEGDKFNKDQCTRIGPSDKCLDDCVKKRSKITERPLYSIVPGSGPSLVAPMCQEFADMEILTCILSCPAKK